MCLYTEYTFTTNNSTKKIVLKFVFLLLYIFLNLKRDYYCVLIIYHVTLSQRSEVWLLFEMFIIV